MIPQILVNGVPVFECELAVTRVAVKRSKNLRLQKKFIKKFGYKDEPDCIQTPMGFYMHPVLFAKLKEAIRCREMLELRRNRIIRCSLLRW